MEQAALGAVSEVSLWSLFMQAGIVVKLVMLGLLSASVWTWAIVIDKASPSARSASSSTISSRSSGRASRWKSFTAVCRSVLPPA